MKNAMNAKIPRAWPRGPQRRAYTPAHTTARNARSRAGGWSCNTVASASTGKPTRGSSEVVSAWSLTLASVTVKSASSAARPPATAAGSECEARPEKVTARPIPKTARVALRSRSRPGSGATNIRFSTAWLSPLCPGMTVSRHEKGAAGVRSAIDWVHDSIRTPSGSSHPDPAVPLAQPVAHSVCHGDTNGRRRAGPPHAAPPGVVPETSGRRRRAGPPPRPMRRATREGSRTGHGTTRAAPGPGRCRRAGPHPARLPKGKNHAT